jgi:hypothetical protein
VKYKFYFKSGSLKVVYIHRTGPLQLCEEIEKAIKDGKQFLIFNAEIIRIDAIEYIDPVDNT